jgi:hypothetical protein
VQPIYHKESRADYDGSRHGDGDQCPRCRRT